MLQSMTGFASGKRVVDGTSIHLELRSVNGRYLDVAFRMSDEMRTFEPTLRAAIDAAVARGKVECRFALQTTAEGRRVTLDEALLAQLQAAENTVRERLPDAAPLSVGEVLRWPGMLLDEELDVEALRPEVARLAQDMVAELIETRGREGARLATLIRERLVRMRELLAQVAPRMPEVVREFQARMVARLQEAAASLDEERIRQEVAVFAQRIDVDEELGRLAAHLDEMDRVLTAGGRAGKRLDFLLQELNREANTLGAKATVPDVSAAAMEMKVLIEQIREQVQNVE